MRHRQEHFRIHKVRRVYNRATNKFAFNISNETTAQLTPRTVFVAEAFGLGVDETQKFKILDTELQVSPQDIVYITATVAAARAFCCGQLELT